MANINLTTLLEESMATAMTDFTETAIQEAVIASIKDTGYITESEYNLIRSFCEKVVMEAADDFAPDEDEIADLIQKLEAAGYTVTLEADKETVDEGDDKDNDGVPDAQEDHGELPEGFEGTHEDAENLVSESASLADKIAAKLNIL